MNADRSSLGSLRYRSVYRTDDASIGSATEASMSDEKRNAYMVRTKDERTYVEPVLDDGTGPLMACWPMAPVVAETPAQAKTLFLREFCQRLTSGVEVDDYVNLRVRTIRKNVDLPVGVRADDLSLWLDEREAD